MFVLDDREKDGEKDRGIDSKIEVSEGMCMLRPY
jgi:hypothetical protein